MSAVRDKIREQSRFARMRLGQEAPELIDVPSMTEVRVALVPLTEAESMAGLIRSANVEVADNISGLNVRNREAVISDVWHACRVPGTAQELVWDTPEQMVDDLQPSDIDYLFDQLTILMDYASPTLANLADQDIDDLKKAFAAIDWKELYGTQQRSLVLCISRLLPDLLAAKFSFSGSTSSLTELNEREKSTSTALTS